MLDSKLTKHVEKYIAEKGYPLKCSVINANYSLGHPFTIGSTHIAKSNIILDPRVAPCAHKGCKASYDEHKYDTILIVEKVPQEVYEDHELLGGIIKDIIISHEELEDKVAFLEPEWMKKESN